ncbi:MAG: 2-hydroxyhepta-2,4-diene-1,7-dioate isomerase, partial [Rhodospirillaceae bacterium]|nr:2-hydroxyhepta-2,4-diene-1,7-dioate isomerase [Rhodospirillaceae bacterium]
MKLMRVGALGQERPAVRMADGSVIDVSSVVNDYDSAWLAAGGMAALESRLQEGT